ncbi:MFS transporter [Sphingomonas sp. IC081]|uniref:MFS transporter n=1 Tax=Sphingomonas sp. IC081 TaxID=304378 RepID=UPI00163B6635|nr:MFS transporter [Sphingomonas sp. IC081]
MITKAMQKSENTLSYRGWGVVLGAAIGLAFSPGPLIFGSIGLFAPHMHEAFGWTVGQIMLALTFLNVASALASPFTGHLIDRLGVRRVLFPSMLLLAAGFVTIAFAVQNLTELYFVCFLWGILTVGTQSISYTKLIAGWFVQRRGLAVGLAAAGLGIGYAIVPVVAVGLIKFAGWRAALAMLGGIVLILPLLANLVLARPRPASFSGNGETLPGMTLSEVRRTATFWQIMFAILLASTALTGVIPNIALFVTDRGFTASEAALVTSTYGISTILGRVLVGWLADRILVSRVAIAFFSLSAFGFALAALFAGTASFPMLLLIALTIGLGFGAESDVIALFIARYFGQRSFGRIYGYMLASFVIGASLGPVLFSFGREQFGSYEAPMLIAAIVMSVSALALAGLSRRPPFDAIDRSIVGAAA